jgi:hypothetical protein
VSKIRRRFLSDRHFLVVVRVLKRREEFGDLGIDAQSIDSQSVPLRQRAAIPKLAIAF